ncbi:MAG: hypothetical protein ACK4RK_19540 [Gemmataceae bacterium]
MRFLEVIDRDGDVGPFDRVVVDANRALEVCKPVQKVSQPSARALTTVQKATSIPVQAVLKARATA